MFLKNITVIFVLLFSIVALAQSPIADDAVLEKIATGFQFTEGPCWRSEGYLVFSDISGNTVYKWTPANGAEVFLTPSGNANGLAEDQDGRLLLAQHGKRQIARLEIDGSETSLASHYDGKRLNSPNDIVLKSDGSIYFTDPPYGIRESEKELSFHGVYRLADGSTTPILLVDSLNRPNGLAFSPDESKLYVCDTDAGRVLVYDVGADGLLINGQEFIKLIGNGKPDGMTVDSDGNIYVASSDDGLNIYASTGDLIDHVDIPERTRNVTLGDKDGRTLYITAGNSVYRLSLKKQDVNVGGKLPDTGQSGDYTSTFGEDSDYAINPPSFTNNEDGTITDNITGLIWQKVDGGEMSWENAQVFSDTLSLGGIENWRLPTSHELFNMMSLNFLNPAINTDYFPKTNAEYWWSINERADDPNRIWVANAGGGIGPHPKTETISEGGEKRFHVRCVSGETVPSQLVDNTNGTVTDFSTGLMWYQEEVGEKTWEETLTFCENLSYAGFDDWRLPNIKEIRSISNDQMINPSIETSFFSNAGANRYWSSTTEINQNSKAWFVDFKFGLTSYEEKLERLFVRCVRTGLNGSTNVIKKSALSQKDFILYQNYPNPFNPVTNIQYNLYARQKIKITILDIKGRIVQILLNRTQSEGSYSIPWNASDLPTGTYFVQIESGNLKQIKKCLLLK